MSMYRHVPQKRSFGWADLFVLGGVAMLIYGTVGLAQQWAGRPGAVTVIDLNPWELPRYSFFSFMRAVASYCISLTFSLIWGYAAAKIPRADRVMIPILDILQAIPVLGFMPGLVLALVTMFPNSNVGVEITCIIMIFTGQAWNMCFSFYSSLKTIPADLSDVSRVIRLSRWERFTKIELPFSAIGLAWNSLMSMAGGWFFLTICESFTLGERKFRVPGIGSYVATAIEQGDRRAMLFGLVAMCVVIIFVDFVIWRPVMAWVRKFQMEEIQEEIAELPFVTTFLRESWLVRRVKVFFKRVGRRRTGVVLGQNQGGTVSAATGTTGRLGLAVIRDRFRSGSKFFTAQRLAQVGFPLTAALCLFGGIRVWELVRTLSAENWRVIWGSVGLTFMRIFVAVVAASLWTIPVGILVGLSPRMTRVFQPVVQIAASFPAPMIFPMVLAALFKIGIGLHWGASVLMFTGIQWYILFNVLAGAMTVTRDLRDSMRLMGASSRALWWKLYLPSAFPALVTGWITASGGAWNASIVAEYVAYGGTTHSVPGIGALIARATNDGNFPMLAGCLIAMVVTVVGLNQTWWRWLSELAETRFRFER